MLKFKKHETDKSKDKDSDKEKQSKSTHRSRSRSPVRRRSRSPRRRSRSPVRRDRSPRGRSPPRRRYSRSPPRRRYSRSPPRRRYSRSPRRDEKRSRDRSRSRSPPKPVTTTSRDVNKGVKRTFKKQPQYNLIEIECNDRLGKKVRVKCSPNDLVGDFKKLVAAQIGTQPNKIVLKKWYKEFKDHISLSDYELHDGMNLELYYR